ncbi:hypothetical protein [Paenibacillus taiwanensis]|uniref:hypothetical protein n=1 Tax=Paenibacillus taiwanensis TaxID=401638 RepID=UPI000401DA13|nr:hypothetical protein [Paenibacillus taiwanensis]
MKKRFLLFLVLLLTLVTIVPTAFAENGETSFPTLEVIASEVGTSHELIDAKEIDSHPDVKAFIIDKGYSQELQNGNLSNIELAARFNIQARAVEGLSADRVNELVQKYNLDERQPVVMNYEQHFFVERDSQNLVSNVWSLNYITSDAGITVSLINVGTDSIDSIAGTLKKYEISKATWSQTLTSSFNKTSVNSGIVHNWITPKNKVSDYFGYNITLKEDGSMYQYNLADRKYQRYNFQCGIYKNMEPLGGERHHIVSKKALTDAGYNADTAAALRMIFRDHEKTPNWGNSAASKVYQAEELRLLKAKKFTELLTMEAASFRSLPDGEVPARFSNLEQKYYPELLVTLDIADRYFGNN